MSAAMNADTSLREPNHTRHRPIPAPMTVASRATMSAGVTDEFSAVTRAATSIAVVAVVHISPFLEV